MFIFRHIVESKWNTHLLWYIFISYNISNCSPDFEEFCHFVSSNSFNPLSANPTNFLIFCMTLGNHVVRKVTNPVFIKTIPMGQEGPKSPKIAQKMRFLGFWQRSNPFKCTFLYSNSSWVMVQKLLDQSESRILQNTVPHKLVKARKWDIHRNNKYS